MARAKRAMGKRRSFTPKDWVYTNDGYREAVFSQNSGLATAFALPLIYSVNAQRIVRFGPQNALPVVGEYQGAYSKPDEARTVVYKVDGHVIYNPSAWALGNEFAWGWRLVIGKMNPILGSLLTDVAYSMWTAAPQAHIAQFRNSGNSLAEGRWYKAFGDNTSNGMWRSEVRWSSRRGRALEHDEGLFLWLEGPAVSVNTVRNRVYCRALTKRPL